MLGPRPSKVFGSTQQRLFQYFLVHRVFSAHPLHSGGNHIIYNASFHNISKLAGEARYVMLANCNQTNNRCDDKMPDRNIALSQQR